MQNPFVGQITVYPYSFAPKGLAACEGQLLPIQQFTALFSLIGTAFGGNGTSSFGLPDLRGRVPLGMGQLPGGNDYLIGESDGVENVTLLTAEMASHNHSLNATTAAGTVNNPSGGFLSAPVFGRGIGASTGAIYNPGTPNTNLLPASLPISGGNVPHNNIQPSLVLMPCIALSGVFPVRN